MRSITFAVLFTAIAGPAMSDDLSSLADGWTRDLGAISDRMIGEARRIEDLTGAIPLPGGYELGIDDLLNEDPFALAEKVGASYSVGRYAR